MFKEIFLRTFPGFLIIRDSNYRIIFINDNLKNLIKSYMQDNPLGMTNIEIAKKLLIILLNFLRILTIFN